MANQGDYSALGTVDFNFTSVSTGGSPMPLANGTVNVYRSNNTTESASGITLTPNYDGRTGLNHVHIETGANTVFYTAGNDYQVILIVGQIAGIPVDGYALGDFSILNRSSPGSGSTDWSSAERTQIRDALGVDGTKATSTGGVVNTINTATANIQTRLPTSLSGGRMDSSVGSWQSGTPLMPTVAGRTLDVTITGEGGVDWANIGGPTSTQNLSATTVKTLTDAVTIGTNNDKTGYALSSTGLDSVAAPADITSDTNARSSFILMMRAIFNRLLNKVDQTTTTQRIYKDDSTTVVLSETVSDDGSTQIKGRSS